MKLGLGIGLIIGLIAGAICSATWTDAFALAKYERARCPTYADNLLTIAAAHSLGQDHQVWQLIGEWGRRMADRLAEKEARGEFKDLGR